MLSAVRLAADLRRGCRCLCLTARRSLSLSIALPEAARLFLIFRHIQEKRLYHLSCISLTSLRVYT